MRCFVTIVLLPTLLHMTTAQNTACCDALSPTLTTYYPNTSPYTSRITSYWSASAQLHPTCIVLPLSTAHVSQTIFILTTHPSCSHTHFAIRSGGHMSWATSNNIEHGVTIDLGYLNDTRYDRHTGVARVQPGARWEHVYGVLEGEGVTVAGGRVGDVGVGGYLTGGGNSFYTAQRGFGCDTVVDFELVLGNGEIIHANAEENYDLFQTLKGGSSNFGIVTMFSMQTFPATPLWGGTKVYNKSTSSQHIDALVAWTDGIEAYPYGSSILFWSYLPEVGDIVIIGAFEDTTGAVAASPAWDKFMAIDATSSTMRIDSHRALVGELEQATGDRNIWFTLTFLNDAAIYHYIVELHEQLVQEWRTENSDPEFSTQCFFQSIPTIFSEHSKAQGGNVLGLDRLEENAVMFLLTMRVTSAHLEDRAREKMGIYVEKVQRFARSRGGLVDWQYLNYADGSQNPIESYGPENVEKMRKVAKKYDPDGVFQNKAPGGFKVSRIGSGY